jgi:Leucine-rich repeat (LRR) protein
MALAARLLELMSAPCSSGGRRLVFGVALQSRTRIPREWIYLVIKYEKNHQNMKKKRPVEAVEAVISLILLLSLVTGSVSGSGKRTNCVYEGDMLHCELRTLSTNSLGGQRNNTSSLLGNTASRAKHVYITCSEANSESILRTNHFGYLPNLKSLTVEACLVRKIPALAFSGLSGLTGLHFRQTGGSSHEKAKIILEIEADAFTGLNDLRLLNFTGNNLWTLPEASLCGLSSLTELNLSSNFIQDVTDLGFATSELNSCRLPLRTLDLSDNSFSTLPEQAFGQLRKLERLNLANNNLNVIHDKALGDLTSLVSLNMAHNQFVALPAHLLAEAKYLQELILNNNTLSVLAPGLFDDLEHLVVLNMSRNEIGNDWLTPDTFASLLRLVALDLSHNRLTKLDRSVLNPLTSLQILDLSYNRIHSVTGNTFLSQVNLHSLQLSNNIIDTLHNEAMASLSVLSSLQLGNNRLSRLDQDVFKNCSSLVDLSLQGNMLVYVPEAIRQIKLLKTLDLGDNLLGKSLTTASLEGLGHLYGLRLAGNGILSLNASVFSHVPKLQVLNLADNELSKLDHGVFNEMSSLRMLRLDNNKLEELNGILAGQTELRFLNVSANRLQWFDYAFLPKTLEWLDIHANQIEDLGNYYRLWGDFSLRFLDASNNLIRSLEYLSLLPSLQMVNLASNKISNVEVSTFANKSNLRRMDLRSNNIERLPLAALNLDTRPKSVGSGESAQFILIVASPPKYRARGHWHGSWHLQQQQ